jgi:acetoin utilization deacetylase AcuC-like enzyme
MRVEPECFGRLTSRIAAIADDCCGGRVVVATEGGYHLKGIADSLRGVISALDDVQPEVEGPPADADAPRGEAAIAAARKNLSKYWPL